MAFEGIEKPNYLKTCCCCGEFQTTPLSATRYVGGTVAIASFVALSCICAFVVGAFITNAVGLNTGMNWVNVAKWAEAAKWAGVAFGGGIGVMVFSKLLDMAIQSCKNKRSHHHYDVIH